MKAKCCQGQALVQLCGKGVLPFSSSLKWQHNVFPVMLCAEAAASIRGCNFCYCCQGQILLNSLKHLSGSCERVRENRELVLSPGAPVWALGALVGAGGCTACERTEGSKDGGALWGGSVEKTELGKASSISGLCTPHSSLSLQS